MSYTRVQKLTIDMLEQIIRYKQKGIDSRDVAKIVGCCHTTVNNYYRYVQQISENKPIKENCTADVLREYAEKHGLPEPIFELNNTKHPKKTEQLVIVNNADMPEFDLRRLTLAIERAADLLEQLL